MMHKGNMAKGPTTGVRLEDHQRDALEKIARENGNIDVSVLIRWAVDALIAHVERNNGRLLLPVDFSETFEVVSRLQAKPQPEPVRKVV